MKVVTCILRYQAKFKVLGWGIGMARQVGYGAVGATRWLDALIVLLVLLVAVLHRDALHASLSDGGSGFLQGEPVSYRVVRLAVECGVENTLQPKIPVFLLQE